MCTVKPQDHVLRVPAVYHLTLIDTQCDPSRHVVNPTTTNKGEFGGVLFYTKNCGFFKKNLYMSAFLYHHLTGDVVEKVL